MDTFGNRVYKKCEEIELPKQSIEKTYKIDSIIEKYKKLIEKEQHKKNENSKNIEKIAIHEAYTVTDKVKDIYKVLIKNKKFVFGKVFSLKEKPKEEVVTAFSGVLELSRRNKVYTAQSELFGDITISKRKRENDE